MAKEECMKCGHEYELYAEGTIAAEKFEGIFKQDNGKDFAMHTHLELCSECAKPVIEFIKNHLGENSNMF